MSTASSTISEADCGVAAEPGNTNNASDQTTVPRRARMLDGVRVPPPYRDIDVLSEHSTRLHARGPRYSAPFRRTEAPNRFPSDDGCCGLDLREVRVANGQLLVPHPGGKRCLV